MSTDLLLYPDVQILFVRLGRVWSGNTPVERTGLHVKADLEAGALLFRRCSRRERLIDRFNGAIRGSSAVDQEYSEWLRLVGRQDSTGY